MKKVYSEPQMIVEDFTVTDMVAKCDLMTNNTFTQYLSSVDPNCRAENNAASTTAHQYISSFGDGEGDFDNADGDNNWLVNGYVPNSQDEHLECFLPKYQTSGFCTFDASGYTFMDYAHNPDGGGVTFPACSKDDSGSSLLQNS